MVDEGLERFGTRAVQLGLAVACLGLGVVALARALGQTEPLAAWADGLGAVPLGESWGLGLGATLLLAGGSFAVGRLVPLAAGLLAVLALASIVTGGVGRLGGALDVGLLGAALSLVAVPASVAARLPTRLAALLDPARPAPRRFALRLGLGLTFALGGWRLLTAPSWHADLLAASGGIAGWPLIGSERPLGLLLWLGAGEVLLSILLVYGPPARVASALAAVLLVLSLLALHTPSLLAAKTIGLLGAAVAGYCWASGLRQLGDTSIGWLRPATAPPGSATDPPGAG